MFSIRLCSVICWILGLVNFGCGSTEEQKAAEVYQPSEISFEGLSTLLSDGENITLVDVRPIESFEAGHIQDAIHIDRNEVLDKAGGLLLNGDALTASIANKLSTVVFYCDGYGMDKEVAQIASELGYQDVRYYLKGLQEWTSKPTYLVMEYAGFKAWHNLEYPFDDGENYLIDTLPVDWYTGDDPSHPGGHIPGALSLPLDRWADAEGNLLGNGKAFSDVVTNTAAKVVIYCGNDTCGRSLVGAKAAATLGYKRVFRFQGGWQEWKDHGNQLKQGSQP